MSSSLSVDTLNEDGAILSIDSLLSRLEFLTDKEFMDKLIEIRNSLVKEFNIHCDDDEYIYFDRLGIPLDSNYSRMAPLQCNEALSLLVFVAEKLALVLSVRTPFKAVHQRPFTYIMSRDQLGTERPQLYPLEFPEATTAGESSAKVMQKLYSRFLTGLSMLNCNILRIGMTCRVRIIKELVTKPFLVLKRILFEQPITEMFVSEQPSISFDAVHNATILQWDQQTV
jgi:hypothetical protein